MSPLQTYAENFSHSHEAAVQAVYEQGRLDGIAAVQANAAYNIATDTASQAPVAEPKPVLIPNPSPLVS
jgi:hypothetical protein